MDKADLILSALLILVGIFGTWNYARDPKGRDSRFYLTVGLFGLIMGLVLFLFWGAIFTRIIT